MKTKEKTLTRRVKLREKNMHSKAIPPKERKRLANLGALMFGAGGAIAASVIGVGELLVGTFMAYVSYRIIRYGVAPTQAILEGVKLEHGEVAEGKEPVEKEMKAA